MLREIGIPLEIMRGFAVISRCAGLVGHTLEEAKTPAAQHMWALINRETEYSGEAVAGER